MTHELILKRPDGSKVKIIVRFYELSRNDYRYMVDVLSCEKGKRTFVSVVNTDDYEYRAQSFPEGREEWAMRKYMEVATKEEILQAKLELWNKLKPE